MCRQYDKLAMLHGRLAIFNATRPSERNLFVNKSRKMLSSNLEMTPAAADMKADRRSRKLFKAGEGGGGGGMPDDILFPAMFTEVRSARRGGHHIVRVSSRLARRGAKATPRALLAEATGLARQALHAAEGPLDDALEDMSLGSREGSTPSRNSDSEGDEDEEEDDDERPGRKKTRGERQPTTAEMLPTLPSDSEEEFTGDSEEDDLDESEVEEDNDDDEEDDDEEDDDEEEDEDEDEEDEIPPEALETSSEGDDEEANSDDGMGEQMRELLQETHRKSGGDKDDQVELQKGKRVRTD
ncbi:unnamed protein product [Phytomonas sp. Hart1]|nr:unnamed protein product [Phytomonas sp. Hart1]|eukprot:CCW70146.1 unnamed protein product [Phytomonas sp. isolate Hart1]